MVTAADLQRLRDGTISLTALAHRDLVALLRDADADAIQALHDVLPGLIEVYGLAAATLAADWYDDVRDRAEVRRSFFAIPATIPDSGAGALIGWATSTATDDESLLSLLMGGTQRRIADFSRLTVTGSATEDPAADGWQRHSLGGCKGGFCDMLAGRGAVYSEATADFAAHDNCRCVAVPAFGGQERPVKPYTPTLRNVTDADRARVREWLRTNLPN